jgi:hypothetical protein
MKRLLLLISTALLLVGCATESTIVYRYKATVPPDDILVDCAVTPPPNKKVYLDSNDKEKEKLLSETLVNVYKDIHICNSRFNTIREWKANAKTIVEGNSRDGIKN